ncbi:MAG: rubredoxin [Cyanobacteria bacterium P01_F01_bin.42]
MSTEATEANEPDKVAPAKDNQLVDQSAGSEVDVQPAKPEEFDRYACSSCGYVYEPTQGDRKRKISAGTPFEELPLTWRCPVCGSKSIRFANVGPKGAPSGFQENLGFGFGVNSLTPGAKGLLIALGLLSLVLLLLSFYGIE